MRRETCAQAAPLRRSSRRPSRKEPRHENYRNTMHWNTLHHPAGLRVFLQPGELPHRGRRDGKDRQRAGRGRDRQPGPGGAEAAQRLRHDRGRQLRERGHAVQRRFRVAVTDAGHGERRHRTAGLFLVGGGAHLHPVAAGHHGAGGRRAGAGAAGRSAGRGECGGAGDRHVAAALRASRGAIPTAGHRARSTDRSELWIRP